MKTNKTKKKIIYTNEDYNSGDGMLTSVWGPSIWHYLHILSFNYPVNPTLENKKQYKDFILNLQYTLPCKFCRKNLTKNFKNFPITKEVMANRETFSKYIYELHELINTLLNKKSGLSYEMVKERYEHFRARCHPTTLLKRKTTKHKENGCTEPLYGKKSKCIIKIVPQENKENTFQMNKKCIKKRVTVKNKK
jgi:hypothetical protein